VLRSLPIRHLQRCEILPALLLPLRTSHVAERRRQRRLGGQEARGRHRQRHGRAALHGEPDRPRQGQDVHHIHLLRGAAGGVQSGQAHVVLRDARSVGAVHDVRLRQGRPHAVVRGEQRRAPAQRQGGVYRHAVQDHRRREREDPGLRRRGVRHGIVPLRPAHSRETASRRVRLQGERSFFFRPPFFHVLHYLDIMPHVTSTNLHPHIQ